MPRLMIIDGNNQYLRAYIVNPTLSPNGQPIGGVVGTLKILQKLCKEINPDEIIITWDGEGGSSKRKAMNKNYKEGRSPVRLNRGIRNLTENEEFENKVWQMTRLAEYLNQLPVIQFLYPNVEADDVISYVIQHPKYADWQKVIVSADKEFIQLFNKTTVLISTIQEEIINGIKKKHYHENSLIYLIHLKQMLLLRLMQVILLKNNQDFHDHHHLHQSLIININVLYFFIAFLAYFIKKLIINIYIIFIINLTYTNTNL